MTLQFMLGTNIAIYVIKNRPAGLLDIFNRHRGQLCISVVTLAELLHGAAKSAWPERNRANVEAFRERLEVLPYGPAAASHYGAIRADLERKGIPIGVNDLHIAGHARSENLTLVSNNLREFARVAGLRVTNWLEEH